MVWMLDLAWTITLLGTAWKKVKVLSSQSVPYTTESKDNRLIAAGSWGSYKRILINVVSHQLRIPELV